MDINEESDESKSLESKRAKNESGYVVARLGQSAAESPRSAAAPLPPPPSPPPPPPRRSRAASTQAKKRRERAAAVTGETAAMERLRKTPIFTVAHESEKDNGTAKGDQK